MSALKSFLQVMQFILRDRFGLAGLVIVCAMSFLALIVPYLPLPRPDSISFKAFLPPSENHPFGTDNLGRDVLSRVLWGTRVSLAVGIVAAGTASLIGIILGAISGFYGGIVDSIISRLIEIFLVIPAFFLALLIVAILGSNIFYIMLVIGVTSWPTTARIIRSQVLAVKEQPYVEAARAVGAPPLYMLIKHILPQSLAPALAYTVLLISRAMIIEAGLSYIGLGDPNLPSWGRMIYEGQPYILSAWWISFFPGLFLSLTVLGWNFLGDALNRYINPKLREGLKAM